MWYLIDRRKAREQARGHNHSIGYEPYWW
jgi:hypothetical protein